ncbi:MAG: DUF481 domain-containing protein [Bacteroidales bacterium]|nr:DUF481 domain-containing protein [Bacteroidales bacterium]
MILRILWVIVLSGIFSTNISAQLVNIEKSRKEAKPGFQGYIDLNLMLTQNTRQIFETGTTAHVQYHQERHTVLLLNNISFMRVEGDNLINNGFQHLRYNYTLGEGFATAEVFTQHQYNSIRLLQRRFLLGGGPRFKILENKNLGIYIAPLVMYEHELLNDDDKTRSDRFKGDLYVSGTFALDERINFSHTTYYQPDFARFSEYRISSETGLEMKFNDSFSFLVTYNLAYDSFPPLDIPNLFYSLKNGIKYSF